MRIALSRWRKKIAGRFSHRLVITKASIRTSSGLLPASGKRSRLCGRLQRVCFSACLRLQLYQFVLEAPSAHASAMIAAAPSAPL